MAGKEKGCYKMSSSEGETWEFRCSGATYVTESEGSGAIDPGLKEEHVLTGEVTSSSDAGLLNMMRVMVAQITELNKQFSEIKNTVENGLAEASAKARQYTDDLCAAIRRDMQKELDACHYRINYIYETVKTQRFAPDASPTPPCVQCPPDTHPTSSTCPPAHSGLPHPLSITQESAYRHPYSFGEAIGRRKPAEFDGTVTWEAYVAQFELMAEAQGWNLEERSLQLVASLRGAALEVLGHLTAAQRTDYQRVVEALRRRFGHHQQAEVYRARLKGRLRVRGEPLPQLAQEVETLVRRAYPMASEDMVGQLTKDHFVDALQDRELQLCVKQSRPKDVREALTSALETEAFLCTSVSASAPQKVFPTSESRVRRARPSTPVKEKALSSSGRSSPVEFKGVCWACGQEGHMRHQCKGERRTRSPRRPAVLRSQPCCWSCGKSGHFSATCPTPKEVMQAGNGTSLAAGAVSQPAPQGPLAI